ncbi:MAG TPA: glutathione S-transferase family protein [Pseudomonadales bacterium]|nr:glutathione S-transferase family protein [Pseudomonadales bacterium]
MSELILHHYPYSPFSEKIRAMLGYANLSWQSVITKEMPPRPKVEQLVGGYRKIPVAQIGADVFCDSHIIAEEIAQLSQIPELALDNCSADAQAFVPYAERDAFFAFIISAGSPTLYKKILSTMSPVEIVRFFWDRIKMGRTASIKMVKFGEANGIVTTQLERMETLLQQDFLFGTQPNHADFAAYHGPWMAYDLAGKKIPATYPNVAGWMQRIKAFGEGKRQEITPDDALRIAQQAQPRPIDPACQNDPLLGRNVQIAPNDYAQTPTRGKLVGSTSTRWIIARHDNQLGNLNVHFPKQGYDILPV